MSFVEPVFPGIVVCAECVTVSHFVSQIVPELLWVAFQFTENGQMVSLVCSKVVLFRENYDGSFGNFVIAVKRYIKFMDRCICVQNLPDGIGVCLVKIPDRNFFPAGMEALCFVDQKDVAVFDRLLFCGVIPFPGVGPVDSVDQFVRIIQ